MLSYWYQARAKWMFKLCEIDAEMYFEPFFSNWKAVVVAREIVRWYYQYSKKRHTPS